MDTLNMKEGKHVCIRCDQQGEADAMEALYYADGYVAYWLHPKCRQAHNLANFDVGLAYFAEVVEQAKADAGSPSATRNDILSTAKIPQSGVPPRLAMYLTGHWHAA